MSRIDSVSHLLGASAEELNLVESYLATLVGAKAVPRGKSAAGVFDSGTRIWPPPQQVINQRLKLWLALPRWTPLREHLLVPRPRLRPRRFCVGTGLMPSRREARGGDIERADTGAKESCVAKRQHEIAMATNREMLATG